MIYKRRFLTHNKRRYSLHLEVIMSKPKYNRIVLKLSGEALAGDA
ncbi:UMP kinase, partial [Brevibacillus sp. SIMBA_076]